MTVSTTLSIEYSRDQIIKTAYQLAGLIQAGEEPDAKQISMATDFLNTELDALQISGYTLRATTRTTLDMISGTAEYALDASVLDILTSPDGFVGSILKTDGTEVPVRAMSMFEWMSISDKTATGVPCQCYIERKSPVNLVFWPVPDDSTYDLRYIKVSFLASAGDGSNTQDISKTWTQYLQYAIARDLSISGPLPMERINLFTALAEAKKKECIDSDTQHGPAIIHFAHSGRNW
jgi:hypothetical protein